MIPTLVKTKTSDDDDVNGVQRHQHNTTMSIMFKKDIFLQNVFQTSTLTVRTDDSDLWSQEDQITYKLSLVKNFTKLMLFVLIM